MEAYRKQLIEKTQKFFSELRDQLKGHESLRELLTHLATSLVHGV